MIFKVLRGLPGSGKSTYAKKLCDSGQYVRINRDTIREMLLSPPTNGKKAFDPKIEKYVTAISNASAEKIMIVGDYHIVLDECNLNKRYLKHWEVLAKGYGYKFEVQGMGVDINECIRRDSLRTPNVGKRVILNMAIRNGLLPDYNVEPKGVFTKPRKVVICDVDGTISDPSHRLHWVRDEKPLEDPQNPTGKQRKNWKEFFEDMSEDGLRQSTKDLLDDYALQGFTIVMVTARPKEYLPDTYDWLKKYNVPFDYMIMRKDGDYRRDDIIKEEILNKFFPDKSIIEAVIDDRNQVLRMWAKNNLHVIDVGNQIEF